MQRGKEQLSARCLLDICMLCTRSGALVLTDMSIEWILSLLRLVNKV